jgi:SET domain-containing protein
VITEGVCEVRACATGKGVFAVSPIPAGEAAVHLSEVFDDRASRHSIQVGEGRHQAHTGEVDDFVNHSCRPSAYLDAENLRIVAREEIAAGEEVTINYSASEWDMAEPFLCRCDDSARWVRGFRHLSSAEQREIEDLVPAWLWAHRHP